MSSPMPGMPSDLHEWDLGHQQIVGAVTSLITYCTDYLQALTGLCGAGVQLMRTFVSPSVIGSFLPAQEKEAAQKMWAVWEEVNKLTQQLVWTVRTQTIQSLKNWLIKQKAGEEHAKTLKPSDLSKLLSSCLLAIMQLQCQFSMINYQTFAELIGSQINNFSTLSSDELSDHKSVSFPIHSPSSSIDHLTSQNFADNGASEPHLVHYENGGDHDHDDDDDDDDDDVADEPPPSSYFLGRRSSYGGSLHTSSPPPLNSALGRRWSVPGGDAALEEGITKEIQQRTGSKSSQYIAGFGRAILGTGNSKRKGSLISKEELDDVIDLLSCGHEKQHEHDPLTPTSSTNMLNLLMPSINPPDWSPPSIQSQASAPMKEHPQNAAGCWGWSSSTNSSQVQRPVDGGLLTVVASPTYKRKDKKKTDGWSSAHRSATYLDTLNSANNQRLLSHSPQPSKTAAPSIVAPGNSSSGCKGDEIDETERAFSIGLSLSRSDLVASVKRQVNEKSNIPVILTPPVEDKNNRNVSFASSDSVGGRLHWDCTKHDNSHLPAGFLPFAIDGPPGPTIWTPSANDYTTPTGTYPYQIEP